MNSYRDLYEWFLGIGDIVSTVFALGYSTRCLEESCLAPEEEEERLLIWISA